MYNIVMMVGPAAVAALAAILWCADNFYKTDIYSSNIYLQELEKSRKCDAETKTRDKAPD